MNAVVPQGEHPLSTTQTPWDFEPAKLLRADFDHLLLWAADLGVSDVLLMTDEPIIVRLDGEFRRVGRRRLNTPEIEDLLNDVWAANAASLLKGGNEIDFAHEVRRSRMHSIRFRANATSGHTPGSAAGIEVTLRSIPEMPPTVDELGVEPEILAAHRQLAASQGLCLVVGATGTGKTTLLAALMRDVIETLPRKVLTYEAPIEFTLGAIPERVGIVVQTEIPRHIASYAKGVANALRRAPNIIMVGEARDRETITGAIQAGLTGHAVYTTIHASSVAAALPRAIGEFPADERRSVLVRTLDVLRLVITQWLVPKVGGGRVALREYLVFDQGMRLELATGDLDRLQPVIHRMVEERGRSLLADAREKFEQGLISHATLEMVAAERGERT
jgi:defect in organelle trafficking protein DotB